MGHTVKALLGYLTLFRHRLHAREVLAGLFWGESSEVRARNSLRTAIWRLRKVLEPTTIPKGTYIAATPMGEVGFNRQSNHWLDVAEFENNTKKILAKHFKMITAEDVRNLENTLTLYKGDLLEGFYDEWALRERERLRSLYLKSQDHLLRYFSHHDAYGEGLACGRNILDLDPLREEIHREMMRLYYRSGQRAMALQQYENCRKILQTDLGVPPMEETRSLYSQFCQKTGHDRVHSLTQANPGNAQQLMTHIQQTLHDFEKSAEQLRRTAKHLERIIQAKDSVESL
jgi:DNA-binding SARP family transcriptional activator